MAHVDLLPTGEHLFYELVENGLAEKEARSAMASFGNYLRLHADYYGEQWKMNRERQDEGAEDALRTLAGDLG